ncbi:MAG TPA: hypothetical protein VL979_10000 [Solirubrobacteraceae bacterium]|nr:hypothetical protein [Solirubrobacteraceae bacterium]
MGILRDTIDGDGDGEAFGGYASTPAEAATMVQGPRAGAPAPAAVPPPASASPAAASPAASTGLPSPGAAVPDPPVGVRSELERRRDALAEQVTEMHWDLGGLAYEMAIRDHFRLDVLVRRAALLQQRDAELAEVERLLRMENDGVAGSCPACAAPHSRGAIYCWQCGATLMARVPGGAAGLDG